MTIEAQIRASVKHNQSKGSITLRPHKDVDISIRAAAERAGQTVTAYILQAVEERMSKEQP